MAKEIVLGLDADGVLLNYLGGLLSFSRRNGVAVGCEAHEVDDWSCARAYPGFTDDQIFAEIEGFSVDAAFAEIEPIEGAVEAIASIKAQFPHIRVVAVTSAGVFDETIRLRKQCLAVFPFDEIHVLPLGASKKEHLADFPAGSIFVDDLYKHVQAAESVGVTGVLFRQPYNAKDSHAHEISDWTEGQELIARLLSATAIPEPAGYESYEVDPAVSSHFRETCL